MLWKGLCCRCYYISARGRGSTGTVWKGCRVMALSCYSSGGSSSVAVALRLLGGSLFQEVCDPLQYCLSRARKCAAFRYEIKMLSSPQYIMRAMTGRHSGSMGGSGSWSDKSSITLTEIKLAVIYLVNILHSTTMQSVCLPNWWGTLSGISWQLLSYLVMEMNWELIIFSSNCPAKRIIICGGKNGIIF